MGVATVAATTAPPSHRQPADQPFASDSIWNTPLGRGAIFAPADADETEMLHSDDIGGRNQSYAWVEDGAFGVYRATKDDPVVRWTFDRRPATAQWPAGGPIENGSIMLHTPASLVFLGKSDGHAVLVEPGGDVAYEAWIGTWSPDRKSIHAAYLVRTDLRGSGIASGESRSEGIRAFGGSLVGGLIRCDELRRGEIPHAVAVALAITQLRKAPTMGEQKVWPASMSDGGGKNRYAGKVPMGALIAIPPEVTLDTLGLTREGLALARAYQRFGGYVVDATVGAESLALLEPGCDRPAIEHLFKDIRTIRDRLTRVTNNSPQHPGGPGPRVHAPPPPLAAR